MCGGEGREEYRQMTQKCVCEVPQRATSGHSPVLGTLGFGLQELGGSLSQSKRTF